MQVQNLCKSFICIVISVVLLIFVCVLLAILSPVYLLRWILSRTHKLFRSDLYKIIPASSAIFLQREIEKEARSNLIITLKVTGNLCPIQFSEKIQNVFLNSKDPKGNLCYPEFTMFAHTWFGYPFWKLDKDFRFENHFKAERIFIGGNEAEYISNFENELLKKPFAYGSSPWKMVLINSVSSGNSYIILKVHHSLGDGHSMFKILMKFADDPIDINPTRLPLSSQPNSSIKTKLLQFLKILVLPFHLSYELVELGNSFNQPLPWFGKNQNMDPDSRTIFRSRKQIQLSQAKSAKLKHGVSITTILLSAVTSTIQKLFKKTGRRIPEFMVGFLPIPRPGHPGGLRNHYLGVQILLPLSEFNKSIRLRKLQEMLAKIANPRMQMLAILGAVLGGALPRWIFSKFDNRPPAITFSIFPGPAQSQMILGKTVAEMYFNIWVGPMCPIFIMMLSYNGQIQIVANADPSIFPTEASLEEFLQEIHSEIGGLL